MSGLLVRRASERAFSHLEVMVAVAILGLLLSVILSAQGGDYLGQNLNRLELFHKMGLRMMIPAYNSRSPLGDGLMEPAPE